MKLHLVFMKDFSQFLIAIDKLSVVAVLKPVALDVLPESAHYSESGLFFNAQHLGELGA
jgi:hypothetical protein